jgi:hypothetical protein
MGAMCQAPLTCDGNNFCQSGTTGGIGQPCNGDGSCNTSDLKCQNNTCVLSCGQPGKACCTTVSNVCATPGDHCYKPDGTETYDPAKASDGVCNDCGTQGQWCCPRTMPTGNGYCGLNTQCDDAPNLTFRCQACGTLNSPCCSGACTDPNSYCDGTSCQPCGISGTICCNGTMCNAGLTCIGTDTCEPCGGTGQMCCPGNMCNNGPPIFYSEWRTLAGGGPDGGISLPDLSMPPPPDAGGGQCMCP